MKGRFCLTKHMRFINSINRNGPAFKLATKRDKAQGQILSSTWGTSRPTAQRDGHPGRRAPRPHLLAVKHLRGHTTNTSRARSCGMWALSQARRLRKCSLYHGAAKMGVSDVPAHVLSLLLVAFFFFLFRGMLSVPQDLPEGKPQDSGGWRSRHQCLPSGWRQDPGSEARAAQGRTPCPAGSYMTRNKGHLALSRGIKLMSKAPETTLPSHRQSWQRKKALTSK